MAGLHALARSFAGGEITPEMFGRVDLAAYQTALALCLNFIVLPHGPAENRTGTSYVNTAGDVTHPVRLIPFTFNQTQTTVIELGHLYARFHTLGATILNGGNPVQITTPYAGSDVFGIHFTQSGDTITLVHASYPSQVLNRVSATNWNLAADQAPNPGISESQLTIHYAGGGVGVVAPCCQITENQMTGVVNQNYQYQVTVTTQNGADESLPMQVSTQYTGAAPTNLTNTSVFANDMTAKGNFNTIGWALQVTGGNGTPPIGATFPVTPAIFYSGNFTVGGGADYIAGAIFNVYRLSGGVYGYIGSFPAGGTLVDYNITPDTTRTPPFVQAGSNINSGAGYYPQAVSYYQQRKCFGGLSNYPLNVYATRPFTETTLTLRTPVLASDAISVRLVAQDANAVLHLIPFHGDLIGLTPAGEFRIYPTNGGALSATSIGSDPQTSIGANSVPPVKYAQSLIYAASRGGRLREMQWNWQANGYLSGDLCVQAPHLFDYNTIVDMALSKFPIPVVWAVNNQGTLLGLTYVPDQQVHAWHHHTTVNGAYESVCVVSENTGTTNEDFVYVVVRRVINGATVRYIERFASRSFTGTNDGWFVDCGGQYSGAPVTQVTGLTWLANQTVSALADGIALTGLTVDNNGNCNLPTAASLVTVGLPITCDLQTLPLIYEQPGSGSGFAKNANKAWLRVKSAEGFLVGPDATHLKEVKVPQTIPFTYPAPLQNTILPIVLAPEWGLDSQIWVRHNVPLPCTVTSITMDEAIGGA